jgi:hypothetical protein
MQWHGPSLFKSSQFPVLWVGEIETEAKADIESLCTCVEALYSHGFRARGWVVRAGIEALEVKRTRVRGYRAPFSGYRLPLFQRIVELEFESSGEWSELSLAFVKDLIVRSKARSGAYRTMIGSKSEYENFILSRRTFEELLWIHRLPVSPRWLRRVWFSVGD